MAIFESASTLTAGNESVDLEMGMGHFDFSSFKENLMIEARRGKLEEVKLMIEQGASIHSVGMAVIIFLGQQPQAKTSN